MLGYAERVAAENMHVDMMEEASYTKQCSGGVDEYTPGMCRTNPRGELKWWWDNRMRWLKLTV